MAQAADPKSVESQLYALLSAAVVDSSTMALLFPEGKRLSYESDIWDYKLGYANPNASQEFTEYDLCNCLKDIVALHNSFGGYLAYFLPGGNRPRGGIDLLTDPDALASKIRAYTGERIRLKSHVGNLTGGGKRQRCHLLLVPKRQYSDEPVMFRKNSATNNKGKFAFVVDDIYLRAHYECVPAGSNLELNRFLIGPRSYMEDSCGAQRAPLADHNMPPEDPNLIKFIGRDESLIKLWRWLRDPLNPVRIITGMGGFGKTAVAYEFSKQLIRSEYPDFQKIVWLTGKSRTYSAILGKMVDTTRTDFIDIDSFLDALLLEIGSTDDNVREAVGRKDKLAMLLEAITTFRLLCIIDDVDTLNPLDQQELFYLVSSVFNRALGKGGFSRVLLTSRLDLAAGPTQTVPLTGFAEGEAIRYIEALLSHIEADETLRKQVLKQSGKIFRASRGSPMFIASIIRLAQHGMRINEALDQWKDAAGEDVRRFAFSKEIGELDYQAKRILYVIQTLSKCTVDEVASILTTGAQTVMDGLGKLRQYHLFSSASDPIAGMAIEVPEPVRLTLDVTRKFIEDDDFKRIDKACARLVGRRRGDDSGRKLNHIMRFIQQGEFDTAVIAAERAVKENPKSGDLSCLLACCYMQTTPPQLQKANDAFGEAKLKSCKRDELLPSWCNVKIALSDWAGVEEITTEGKEELVGVLAFSRLSALRQLARASVAKDDIFAAYARYRLVMEEANTVMRDERAAEELASIRRIKLDAGREYFSLAARTYDERPDNHVEIFNAMMDCTEFGVADGDMIASGVRKLISWWSAVENRQRREPDLGAIHILENKLADLDQLRARIIGDPRTGRLDQVYQDIVRRLQHYKSRKE